MKQVKRFFKTLLIPMFLTALIMGCSSEDTSDSNTELETTDELRLAAEIDNMEVVLGDVMVEVYESQESQERNASSQPPSLPDCVTITLVAQQNFREITIDFAEDGCEIRGHVFSGQIVLSYERDPMAQQVLINYSLNNLTIDNRTIMGTKTILKQLSNENGNPQFTHNLELTVTWPNGAQAYRQGEKVREWIEGFGSGIFSDNVFEVTGYWNSTFVNGNTHTHTVIMPLRREVICTYFVSGSVDVERTNFSGVFDYGDGDCDNQATFTFNNGTVIDVILN